MTASKDPRSLAELLGSGSLGRLTAEAERRRGLTDRIRSLLPPDEATHLVAATRDAAGGLVLTMDASVWAARVRYLAESLGEDRIKVKVLPRPDPADS